MSTTLLTFILMMPIADQDGFKDRKPNPLAPSIPELTEQEEAQLDYIINRFMLADIGQLRGLEARKAFTDFSRLGPEAIPALLRGLNRSAGINDSCPVVVIAKKLNQLLRVSTDEDLLQLAREQIGAGVGPTRHGAVLKDLRLSVTFRLNAVSRMNESRKKAANAASQTDPSEELGQSPASMSVDALSGAIEKTEGATLKAVLDELGARDETKSLVALAQASRTLQEEAAARHARSLLVKSMSRQREDALRKHLTHELAELRGAAVFAVYRNKLMWVDELIELLDDEEAGVRRLAHQALLKLTKKNFGPTPNAGASARKKAILAWKAWWAEEPKGVLSEK